MPNRLIKESICSSDNIDNLSLFEEVFFYRLIVNCDDYGRMDARPEMLASKLFPLRRGMKTEQITGAVMALLRQDLIVLYEVKDRTYLQMKTWGDHQQIRAKKSKYPAPDEGHLIANDFNCNQLISDDSKCPRNPIQSNTNPNTNPIRSSEMTSELFDKFWKAYPRKVKKPNAMRAWKTLKVDDDLFTEIMSGLDKWTGSEQWKSDGGRYIPYPASWLNARQWEDEVKQTRSSTKVTAQSYTQRDYDDEQKDAMRRMLEGAGA